MAGVAADPIVDLGLVRNPCPVVRAVLGFDAAADCYVAGDPQAFGMTRTPPVPKVSADRPHRRPARPPALGTPICVYIVGFVELMMLLIVVLL